MTAPATIQQTLFDALTAQCGGAQELEPAELALIGDVARCVIELHTASATDAARIADTLVASIVKLPAYVEAQQIDLSQFTDSELAVLHRARSILDANGDPGPDEAAAEVEKLKAQLEAAERRATEARDKYGALLYMLDKNTNPDTAAKMAAFRIRKLEAEVAAQDNLIQALDAKLADMEGQRHDA
jgi:hypothetical protein